MEFIGSVFQWLMTHQPAFPYSLLIAGVAFLWTGVIRLLPEVEGDDIPFPLLAVLGVMAAVVGVIHSVDNGNWYPFVSMGLGLVLLPGFYLARAVFRKAKATVQRGWKALSAWSAEQDRLEAEKRKSQDEREAVRRKAAESSPKAVLQRAEATIEQVRKALPLDLEVVEEGRQAQAKLDALRELYELLAHMEALAPGNDDALTARIAQADALFADVSLEKEVGVLIRKLRKDTSTLAQRRKVIHAAIEALVLSIASLPDRVAARLAMEAPVDYQVAAADLQQEAGEPVLPVITPPSDLEARLAQEPEPATRPNPKKQLA